MNRRPMSVAIALLFAATLARAAEPEPRMISTTGTASVFVAPDRVDVRFSVTTFDADLAKAKSQNDAAAAKVIDFLKHNAIEEKDVQAELATSEPIYAPVQSDGRWSRGPLTGFNVMRTYNVRLDDIAKFAAVVDRLLTDPTVTVAGHAFTSKDDRKYRDQARRDACVAAKEKAKLLAEALGASVGSPRTIAEVPTNTAMPMFRVAGVANHAMDANGAGAGELSPIGQIEIRGEVNVTFDLVPGITN